MTRKKKKETTTERSLDTRERVTTPPPPFAPPGAMSDALRARRAPEMTPLARHLQERREKFRTAAVRERFAKDDVSARTTGELKARTEEEIAELDRPNLDEPLDVDVVSSLDDRNGDDHR